MNISAVSPEFIFKIFTYRGKLSVFTNDQMWVFAFVYAHIDKEKKEKKTQLPKSLDTSST